MIYALRVEGQGGDGLNISLKEVFKMSNQKRKVRSWFISCAMLASLLCAGYAAAKDKDQPQTPAQTDKGQGKDKAQPHVGSIFDDQADEFEEPTYTPPADIEEKIKSIPPIPSNIKNHLKYKYVQIDDFIISTLQQTPHGPSGKINIGGDIVPKTTDGVPIKSVITETGRKARASAIAKAIIAEEVSLLGITDMDEVKEVNSLDRPEGVSIYFQRYIGALPFEYGDIAVHFKADGETIMSLQANVVAPPLPCTKQFQLRPSDGGRYTG